MSIDCMSDPSLEALYAWLVRPECFPATGCGSFGQGEEVRDGHGTDIQVLRKGIKREVVEKVRSGEGKLSLAETLRHRVTYFSAGVALGRRAFVDEYFEARREQFDARRKSGARPLKGGNFAGMFAFRAPRVGVV